MKTVVYRATLSVIGLTRISRREALVKTLRFYLAHNPEAIDAAEAFVESLTKTDSVA